ncbi:carbohydrate porin [Spirulina sp. CS-785/01]|uniref:carbohydrate porin n=1 Tax=Spirulina sp. CS-785/01 TaxID=3021716 RepID=UPI00232F8AA9|nr:carbohydrate porin [Spirulina sp. CS-785/01]MDB9314426.1 carbohydrate porin [Spirulina sp. CS-785/01]
MQNVSGWFGYEWTDVQDFEADYNRLTWGLNLGFPNLFGGQHEFGLSVGVPPYVTRESGNFLERQDEPFLAQVYYRYDVTDYLAIQPGIMYLDNPAGNETLEDIWLGTLRFQVTF